MSDDLSAELERLVSASAALILLVGCGGRTSSENGSGTCSNSPGTYTQHFTAEASQPACPSIPDQTVTLTGNETLSAVSGAGNTDGANCTTNVDSSTCTVTSMCDVRTPFQTPGGESTTTTITALKFTLNGSSGTGSETIDTTDTSVAPRCTYEFTLTEN
jgi:hypothetical protein